MARCSLHSDRSAQSRCMLCAKELCAACSTRIHGRWLCTSCLKKESGRTLSRVSRSVGPLDWVLAGMAFLALWGLGTSFSLLLAMLR